MQRFLPFSLAALVLVLILGLGLSLSFTPTLAQDDTTPTPEGGEGADTGADTGDDTGGDMGAQVLIFAAQAGADGDHLVYLVFELIEGNAHGRQVSGKSPIRSSNKKANCMCCLSGDPCPSGKMRGCPSPSSPPLVCAARW